MNLRLALALLLSVAFGSACSTIEVLAPAPSVLVPVPPSAANGLVAQIGVQSGRQIQLVKDTQSRPPDLTQDVTGLQSEPVFRLEGRFMPRFDLGFEYGGFSASPALRLRYLALGPSVTEAQDGDWSLALGGRLAFMSRRMSGDQEVTFGPGGFPWSAQGTAISTGLMASIGTWANPSLLLFLGYSAENLQLSATVSQEPSDNGASSGGRYQKESGAWSQTLAVGSRLGQLSALVLQFQFHELHAVSRERVRDQFLAAHFEYHF
jgi:hypothetical protein